FAGDFYRGSFLIFAPSISGIVIVSPSPPGLNDVSIGNLSLRSQGGSGTRGVMAHATTLSNGLGYMVFENLDIGLFQRGVSLEYCQICSIRSCQVILNEIGIYQKRCINIKIFDSVSELNSIWGLFIDGDLDVI